jgi:hypothetical protein
VTLTFGLNNYLITNGATSNGDDLKVTNKELASFLNLISTFDDLYHGGHRIADKARQYVVIRPDEKPSEYEYRLSHFTYTNILGDAIRDVASRVSRAPYAVHDWPKTGVISTLNIVELARSFLLSVMRYGAVWYLASDRGIDLIDPNTLKDYRYGPDGNLLWLETIVKKESGVTIKTKYSDLNIVRVVIDESGESSTSTVDHELGRCPVRHISDSDLWVMNHGYLKALQYTGIENSQTVSAIDSDQVQRLFKPSAFLVEGPDGFIDEDQRIALKNVRSNNKSLLIGDDFKFAERTSNSIPSTSEVLDKISRQIRDIVSYGGIYESSGNEASGKSKYAEFELALDQMATYGTHIVRCLNLCLADLTEIGGLPIVPRISGFNYFALDSNNEIKTKALLELVERVLLLPIGVVTPTASKELLLRFNTALADSTDQMVLEAIEAETTASSIINNGTEASPIKNSLTPKEDPIV